MLTRLCTRLILGLSLLLILAITFLWIRTYSDGDILALHRGPYQIYPHEYAIASYRGRLQLSADRPVDPADITGPWWLSWRVGNFYGDPGFCGFARHHSKAFIDLRRPRLTAYALDYILIPHWFLLLLAATPWLWFAMARLRHRRHLRHSGLCPTCSYDLRAHKPGQNCPECGTPIPVSPVAKPSTSN